MQKVRIELSRLFAAVLGALLVAIVVVSALTLVRVDRIEERVDQGTYGKADRAVAEVHAAIRYWQLHGEEETIRHYNDPGSIDGQFYVVITRVNADGTSDILAHPYRRDFVGEDVGPIEITAVDGDSLGDRLWRVGRGGGGWVSYFFPNPATGEESRKHAYAEVNPSDVQILFVSGYYEPVE